VDASCGGQGLCGRCAVQALSGRWSPLHDDELRAGRRLACRSSPLSDGSATLLSLEREAVWAPFPASALPPGTVFLAADLGTTTISVAASGQDGEPLVELRTTNPQVAWGSDVLRRLAAAADPGEAGALRETIRRSVGELAACVLEAGRIEPSRVRALALAGNSAMTVLFLGLDPRPLSVAPFRSGLERLRTVALDPGAFGLPRGAETFFLPGIASFVGSDTTGGLLAAALDRGMRPALFLDAGTNGEIVLAPSAGPMLAASTAAGPAFEGGHLTCGGPGTAGAVYGAEVRPTGEVRLQVIGGGPARWVCGSGVLQLAAAMLDAGALREDGRLEKSFPGVGEEGGMAFFRLCSRAGSPEGAPSRGSTLDTRHATRPPDLPRLDRFGHQGELRLTQGDVREVQLAVGAIRAGWRILLQRAGLQPRDLRRVVVTGSFGKALDAHAARRTGLLPSAGPEPEALPSGAVRGLLRAAAGLDSRGRCESLARGTVHVPLGDEAFQEVFLDSLALRPYP
jgi:uncharacterized 2Fe-2S/4Fe-4S cluster protein (DUF4445 family)